ncbi:MAG: hypothetical protein Kow0029_15630 [Candidatus Rifleibacteriota bacterium]
MRLAIHTIDTEFSHKQLISALGRSIPSNLDELFLISLNDYSPHTIRLTSTFCNRHIKTDLYNLVRLLLAHPAFCSRPGFITPLYSQILQLLGICNETVNEIREELSRRDYLTISATSIKHLFSDSGGINFKRTFNIKLHNNFRSMIKKVSLNMFQVPVIENYAERQINDYSLQDIYNMG